MFFISSTISPNFIELEAFTKTISFDFNMFFEDDIYAKFLADMRNLLNNEKAFYDRYCKVNNVVDRNKKVIEQKGCETYVLEK